MKSTRLQIRKDKVVTHRSHNKHHLLWLKKPKHDKIDLATPTTPLFSSVKRVGMRRWRSRRGISAKVPKSIHNSATRAALSESIKQSGCPKGIASREWAKHSSTRCELRRGETSWHSIFQRIVAVRNHISQCYCPCCQRLVKAATRDSKRYTTVTRAARAQPNTPRPTTWQSTAISYTC